MIKPEELEKEIQTKQKLLDNFNKLKEIYPDIKTYTGRWKKEVFCSPSVNPLVNRFEHRFNCGCCSDSDFEVWPYLETEFGNIYSDPACFKIGEKCYYGGASPYPNWRNKLTNISEIVIKQIEDYFLECKEDALKKLEEDKKTIESYYDINKTQDPSSLDL